MPFAISTALQAMTCKERAITGLSGAGADVRIRIRAGVVQIHREHTRPVVRVPIAATVRHAGYTQPLLLVSSLASFIAACFLSLKPSAGGVTNFL